MEQNEINNPIKPLGLPPGSVRAILSLAIIFTGCFLVIRQVLVLGTIPDWFIAILTTAFTYYFASKK